MATIKGYELAATSSGSVDWKASNNMSRTTGRKGSTEYLFKLYARYPDPAAFTPRAFDEAVARCHAVHRQLVQLNKSLRSGDSGSGQLAYATEIIDNTTGSDQGIIEVVPVVKGGKSLDQFTGSREERLLLLESLAQAVVRLHSVHIRHADMKLENALFVRNGRDLKVVLIDFDHSTPEDQVLHPDFPFGTDGYLPPEALDYFNIEDDEDEALMARLRSRITCKSDIFALGMMFYLLLTLEKAAVDPNTAAYRINPAHPALGGYLTELVTAMVAQDPDDRPTAEEVLQTLQTKSFADSLPPFDELWPEHAGYRIAETNPTGRMKVKRVRRCEQDGEKCYRITLARDGVSSTRIMDFTMLRNGGYLISQSRTAAAAAATAAGTVSIPGYTILCEGLNPADSAACRLDEARMRASGYQHIYHCKPATGGPETYILVKGDGSYAVRSLRNLEFQRIILTK